MSHLIEPPKIYRNQKLIDELNEFCIAIKIHGGYLKSEGKALELLKERHPKPTLDEIDKLQKEVNEILSKETVGIKY